MQDHPTATTTTQNEINALLKTELLNRVSAEGSHPTAIPGFYLVRRVQTNATLSFYRPFIGLTVQGAKRTLMGREEYSYGPYHCFVNGVDMPSSSYVTEASDASPFLALSLDLDKSLVTSLAAELPALAHKEADAGKCSAVVEAEPKVMLAFLRLVRLLNEPEDIPIMAPMLIREIHYRLLLGSQGAWLRSICALGTASNRIAAAVSWLRANFREPLLVDDLARKVGMSPSSFFRNFRKMTSLSPLQYQKALRLYEAQRLMLNGEYDVASAAYAVGYESPTQFSREYKRMFGESPLKDTHKKRLELC